MLNRGDLICAESAGGHSIQYSGYVEAEIKFSDLRTEAVDAPYPFWSEPIFYV